MSMTRRLTDERLQEWMNAVISACPSGTSLEIFTENYSYSMTLLISRSINLGETAKGGVWHARTKITITAKELSSSQQTALEEYVAARVITAVQDQALLRTTAWDMATEEYLVLWESRSKLIKQHSPSSCSGLRRENSRQVKCHICRELYLDELYGRKLLERMIAIEVLYGNVAPLPERDEGFSPTTIQSEQYNPNEDSFANYVTENAGRLIR